MQFHHHPIVTVGLAAALSFGSVVAPALAVDGSSTTGSASANVTTNVQSETMQEEPLAVEGEATAGNASGQSANSGQGSSTQSNSGQETATGEGEAGIANLTSDSPTTTPSVDENANTELTQQPAADSTQQTMTLSAQSD